MKDTFNYKEYLRNNPLLQDTPKENITESQISEKKYKQGYDDREDESHVLIVKTQKLDRGAYRC